MKVLFPETVSSVSVQGVEYVPDDNGEAEIPDEHLLEVMAFGIFAIEDETVDGEWDVADLLQYSIAVICSKFEELSDEQLLELQELEANGAKRSTLLVAVDKELAARAE